MTPAPVAPEPLQTRLDAARASLHALGVTITTGAPTNSRDGAEFDPDTTTLTIEDNLPAAARLAVMTDLWTALINGTHTTRYAHVRRHLALIHGASDRRRPRRPLPTVFAAAVPFMLVAACLYPATAPVVPTAATSSTQPVHERPERHGATTTPTRRRRPTIAARTPKAPGAGRSAVDDVHR